MSKSLTDIIEGMVGENILHVREPSSDETRILFRSHWSSSRHGYLHIQDTAISCRSSSDLDALVARYRDQTTWFDTPDQALQFFQTEGSVATTGQPFFNTACSFFQMILDDQAHRKDRQSYLGFPEGTKP